MSMKNGRYLKLYCKTKELVNFHSEIYNYVNLRSDIIKAMKILNTVLYLIFSTRSAFYHQLPQNHLPHDPQISLILTALKILEIE